MTLDEARRWARKINQAGFIAADAHYYEGPPHSRAGENWLVEVNDPDLGRRLYFSPYEIQLFYDKARARESLAHHRRPS